MHYRMLYNIGNLCQCDAFGPQLQFFIFRNLLMFIFLHTVRIFLVWRKGTWSTFIARKAKVPSYEKALSNGNENNDSPLSLNINLKRNLVKNVIEMTMFFIRLLYLVVYQNVSARCVHFGRREFDVFHFGNVQEIHS